MNKERIKFTEPFEQLPRHKKTCLWGLKLGKSQTSLLSQRD